LDSEALTKIQSVVLVAIVFLSTLVGVVTYIVLSGQDQTIETIKIGICDDLDDSGGRSAWRGAVLAAEEVNAEGGVLGRQFEIVAEDDDSATPPFDVTVMTNALTRLITVDKADFIFKGYQIPFVAQDLCADHKVIMFSVLPQDELTQRVADDYERYKGFFRVGMGNTTSSINGLADSISTLRNYTGFVKIAFLSLDNPFAKKWYSEVANTLEEQGFEIVYENSYPPEIIDFSSYFAAIEASGAEILVANIPKDDIAFVKEYYDRQSPFVVWGNAAGEIDTWETTDGKCNFISVVGYPVVSGFPLTSKTLPMREAYIERWGEIPQSPATILYDLVRFILPNAIKRSGTLEYEAMIEALEQTSVETSTARNFVFTSAHDVMMGENLNDPEADYMLVALFQWQNGEQVPVYPKKIMEEAGATLMFPDWPGPWDNP